MRDLALHPMPRVRDVVLAQIRTVALELRGPAAGLAALLLLATLAIIAVDLRKGDVVDFHPEGWMLPGVAGLLLPIGVWKGRERFGPDFLWTFPVDRRQHALIRVFAGWTWLMCAVALFVLWLLALTIVSGGSILPEETLRLLPDNAPRTTGTVDPAAVQTVRWTPGPLLWLVPFTAATGTYLLASALALGVRHPLRWIVGTVLVVLVGAAAVEVTNAEWVADAAQPLLESLFFGRYGFDTLLTARTESLKIDVPLSTGERVVLWRGLPDLGEWAAATMLWTAAGLTALWAAASRHREGRRA